MSLANVDPRILDALRAVRSGKMSYTTGRVYPVDLVSSFAADLGYPAAWGDVTRIPARGGPNATAAWKTLGVPGREGLGGIPEGSSVQTYPLRSIVHKPPAVIRWKLLRRGSTMFTVVRQYARPSYQ